MDIVWNESYSVNIDELDQQHQKLFEMFRKYRHAISSNSMPIMQIVSEMKRYALLHFATEEKIMFEKGYDRISEHKLKHLEYQETFKQYEEKLFMGRAILPSDIIDFIQNWLIKHIHEEDKGYAEFYKQHNKL
jgi:hemerythrin